MTAERLTNLELFSAIGHPTDWFFSNQASHKLVGAERVFGPVAVMS